MAKKAKGKKDVPPRIKKMDEKGENKLDHGDESGGKFREKGGVKKGKGK